MITRWLNKVAGAVLFGLAMLALNGPAVAENIKMTIGYQTLWATVGEVFETLRHTNILELNGIEAEFAPFTYGGRSARATSPERSIRLSAPTRPRCAQ